MKMKKLLSVVFLLSLVVSFTSVAPNINAMQIPEGAIIKTEHNPDVYIVKYKNGKQFKRLVLNPQVFESYGHLKWEDILTVSQSEMSSFATSNLVRVDGQVDIYQLVANGDIGSKHYLVSNNFDLDSIYTINNVDFGNYTMGGVKGVEDLVDTADNDSDGLENWEEDQRGTDKNNPDTDGDGIVDGLDSHPAGGGRSMAQHFEWDYLESHWTWDLSLPSDWYDYYKNKERKPHGADYVTYDDYYVKQIADMLEKKSDEKGYSKSEFAVAFIQSLGYVSDDVIGYDDYPKYPLETLAEQNGDCEDTSYLISAIVMAMNIDNVLVELPSHMAVAIAFSGSPEGYYYKLSNGWDYYYIETTAENWLVGEIPDEYKNTKAKLVKIPSNEAEEKSPSYIPFTNNTPTPSQNDSQKSEELERSKKALQALKQLLVLTTKASEELDVLYKQIEEKNVEIENAGNGQTLLSTAQLDRILAKLIPEYNFLIEQYNIEYEHYKKMLSMTYVINDYKNNIYITVGDRAFLGSLGISLN